MNLYIFLKNTFERVNVFVCVCSFVLSIFVNSFCFVNLSNANAYASKKIYKSFNKAFAKGTKEQMKQSRVNFNKRNNTQPSQNQQVNHYNQNQNNSNNQLNNAEFVNVAQQYPQNNNEMYNNFYGSQNNPNNINSNYRNADMNVNVDKEKDVVYGVDNNGNRVGFYVADNSYSNNYPSNQYNQNSVDTQSVYNQSNYESKDVNNQVYQTQGFNNNEYQQNYNLPQQNNYYDNRRNPQLSDPINDQKYYYNTNETQNYYDSVNELKDKHPQSYDQANERNIGINLNLFIDRFLRNSAKQNFHYRLAAPPKRIGGTQKDSAVFCVTTGHLCFTITWEKGKDKIHNIAMVSTGSGTPSSVNETINNIKAFIGAVTPGLNSEHQEAIIRKMGVLNNVDIGTSFVVTPENKKIRYEHSRSAVSGLVFIASSI